MMYLTLETRWQALSLRRDKVIETSLILLKLRQDDRLIRFSLELTHSPTVESSVVYLASLLHAEKKKTKLLCVWKYPRTQGITFSKTVKYCRSYTLCIIVRTTGFSRSIQCASHCLFKQQILHKNSSTHSKLILFSLNSSFFLSFFVIWTFYWRSCGWTHRGTQLLILRRSDNEKNRAPYRWEL